MGCPPSVRDAQSAADLHAVQNRFHAVQVPYRVEQVKPPLADNGYSRGVVTPILQLPQTPEENISAGAIPHVTNYSAHIRSFLSPLSHTADSALRPPQLALHGLYQTTGNLSTPILRGCLHHDTHYRLSTGRPDHYPTVAPQQIPPTLHR